MQTNISLVTPDIAKRWLQSSNNLNRNLRDGLVNKYAADILDGKWRLTHQGIAFYDDGTLADGQHRLSAIVKAGVSVSLMVTTDMPRDNGKSIDQHAARRLHDALRFSGADSWMASVEAVAVIRHMMQGMGYSRDQPSADGIEAYGAKYAANIQFAMSVTSTKRRSLSAAALTACYACAHHAGEPEPMIARFAEVILTGLMNSPEESAAIRLREFLLFTKYAWNSSRRLSTSKRAERAIQAFCQKQSLAKLHAPDKLIYPVPA